MEIGIAILLFVCMTALLYVILSLKITRQVDLQIKEFYKTRIHSDMQEFYREMEGYAALFENRIQRFRVLVERNEAILREADAPKAETLPEVAEEVEPEIPAITPSRRNKKNQKKLTVKARAAAKVKTPAKVVAVKKQAQPAKPVLKAAVRPPVEAPVQPPPQRNYVPENPRIEIRRPVAEAYPESDDSTIAEELMKDLFLKDEVELTQRNAATPAKTTPAPATAERPESPGTVRQSSPQVANFFSRLGKAIEPVIFGDKTPAEAPAKPEIVRTAPAAAMKPTSDFSEVLRRAEQIKAEKQAERERAEVEAKAEFYAAGDIFQNNKGFYDVEAKNLAAARVLRESAPVIMAEAPRRNALVVKELDRHTVNFLIDSLVKDNGYRKQALRALTENNIPLDEIARLSKIDIGELELMRQLGRF